MLLKQMLFLSAVIGMRVYLDSIATIYAYFTSTILPHSMRRERCPDDLPNDDHFFAAYSFSLRLWRTLHRLGQDRLNYFTRTVFNWLL